MVDVSWSIIIIQQFLDSSFTFPVEKQMTFHLFVTHCPTFSSNFLLSEMCWLYRRARRWIYPQATPLTEY
jgi:hypothetical protein